MGDHQDKYQERWVEHSESNGLGVAGFVISLVGLVATGGLLCPIGMVISFAAMFRRPRGLAVAGFIIGLIGSLWIIILLVVLAFAVLIVGVVALAMVIAVASGELPLGAGIEMLGDGFIIRDAVIAYENETGQWPTSVDDLTSLDDDARIDFWGNPYIIDIDSGDDQLNIETLGADGEPDTGDEFDFNFNLDR